MRVIDAGVAVFGSTVAVFGSTVCLIDVFNIFLGIQCYFVLTHNS